MEHQPSTKWLAYLVVALLLLGAAAAYVTLNGCTTLAQVGQVNEMEEAEFILWRDTLTEQVATIVEAGYQEGEIEGDDIKKVASILAVIGGDSGAHVGSLVDAMNLSGYKGAVLKLAFLELDSKLQAGGAYVDGVLGVRGKETLLHLGARMSQIPS